MPLLQVPLTHIGVQRGWWDGKRSPLLAWAQAAVADDNADVPLPGEQSEPEDAEGQSDAEEGGGEAGDEACGEGAPAERLSVAAARKQTKIRRAACANALRYATELFSRPLDTRCLSRMD